MTDIVGAFGEALWDLLPDGAVLGGAPCNFAYRVQSLGGQPALISRLGTDALGDEAFRQIQSLGLDCRHLQHDPAKPTGTVKIRFDANQQPDYEIVTDVAYDFIATTPALLDLARSCRCLCFGTLAQRNGVSRETVRSLIGALDRANGAFTFLDINLRKDCYTPQTVAVSLEEADILKLNEDEAHAVSAMLDMNAADLPSIAQALITRFDLRLCLITLGERGALCAGADHQLFYEPGYEVTVADPCGSGDAFSAGFLMQFIQTHDIGASCRLGNMLGAIVATQRGATAPASQHEIDQFRSQSRRRISDPRFNSYATTHEGNQT